MLISPVVIPIEENVFFFDEQLENVNLVPIKYYQLRCESSQKAVLETSRIEAMIAAKMPKKKTKIDVKQAYQQYYFNIF